MQRKQPSNILKFYEALACIGDTRLYIIPSDDGIIAANVISSDRLKEYIVKYRQSDQSIMSNDDTSYLYDEVGYASLSLLLFLDILDYQSEYGEYLSGISGGLFDTENDNGYINQQKIDNKLSLQGLDTEKLHNYCNQLMDKLRLLNLKSLGEKMTPIS